MNDDCNVVTVRTLVCECVKAAFLITVRVMEIIALIKYIRG